ncbi:hypothetical protein EMIT07CA2_30449 [Brevibacillus sp. IT-7CA2]
MAAGRKRPEAVGRRAADAVTPRFELMISAFGLPGGLQNPKKSVTLILVR